MTAEGLVDDTMTTFGSDLCPVAWRGYVLSNYPLFAEDMLVQKGSTFGGLVERDLVRGRVGSCKRLVFYLKCSLLMSLVNLICASIPVTFIWILTML